MLPLIDKGLYLACSDNPDLDDFLQVKPFKIHLPVYVAYTLHKIKALKSVSPIKALCGCVPWSLKAIGYL